MAHASCPNGHGMWNGDGAPVVWAFRVNFFRDYMKRYPGFVFDGAGECSDLYDCVCDFQGEDLDCWYCEICKGLVVFVDLFRYDFVRMEAVPSVTLRDVADWEEYIALRDIEYGDFQEYCAGKSPVEAIENYPFKFKYRLSPDKKTIYAFDRAGVVQFGYAQSNFHEFDPDMKIIFRSSDGKEFVYRPFENYKPPKTLL